MRGTPVSGVANGTTSATATFLVSSTASLVFYVTDIVVYSDTTANVRMHNGGTNVFLTRVQGTLPFYASFSQPINCGTSAFLGVSGNTLTQVSMYGFSIP